MRSRSPDLGGGDGARAWTMRGTEVRGRGADEAVSVGARTYWEGRGAGWMMVVEMRWLERGVTARLW